MRYFMKSLALLLSFICFNSFAQDLMYPELQVTPRATKRIRLEMRGEAGNAWTSNLPVQLSALATLAAGMSSGTDIDIEKDESKISQMVAIGVGATWLAATTWAASAYRPYRSMSRKLKKLRYKSKRDKLTAERLAEEEINSLRRIGKRIRWYSTFSNLGASMFLMGSHMLVQQNL